MILWVLKFDSYNTENWLDNLYQIKLNLHLINEHGYISYRFTFRKIAKMIVHMKDNVNKYFTLLLIKLIILSLMWTTITLSIISLVMWLPIWNKILKNIHMIAHMVTHMITHIFTHINNMHTLLHLWVIILTLCTHYRSHEQF